MAKRKPNNNTKIKLPGVVIVMFNVESDKKDDTTREENTLIKAVAS